MLKTHEQKQTNKQTQIGHDDMGITTLTILIITVLWYDTVKMGRLIVLRGKALSLLIVETIYRVF